MKELIQALKKIPRVDLGAFPTPLQPLKNMERDLAFKNIYIKRDDLTGVGPGGNKARTLEFLLGEAIAGKSDVLIVSGPVQSNLCSIAAAACAKLNLTCIIVHNGKEEEKAVGNQILNRLLNAEMHFVDCEGMPARDQYVQGLVAKLEENGHTPYIVKNGSATGVGSLGYVSAIVELVKQCKQESISLGTLFAPGGYGGVSAGLILGNALAGNPFHIAVMSVEDTHSELHANIMNIINEAKTLLGLSLPKNFEDGWHICDDYRGEGWAYNTVESEKMVHSFVQKEGIFIENIYTSKVLVGMEDYIKNGKVTGNVCYLHTGGFGSLFSQF